MADVEWNLITTAPVRRGDLVSAEAGGLPIYEVVEIDRDRLWLRDSLSQRDHVLPTNALRWRMTRTAVQTG